MNEREQEALDFALKMVQLEDAIVTLILENAPKTKESHEQAVKILASHFTLMLAEGRGEGPVLPTGTVN